MVGKMTAVTETRTKRPIINSSLFIRSFEDCAEDKNSGGPDISNQTARIMARMDMGIRVRAINFRTSFLILSSLIKFDERVLEKLCVCEFRFNHRGKTLYKLLLKIIKKRPLN
jgi:hypothetical protein